MINPNNSYERDYALALELSRQENQKSFTSSSSSSSSAAELPKEFLPLFQALSKAHPSCTKEKIEQYLKSDHNRMEGLKKLREGLLTYTPAQLAFFVLNNIAVADAEKIVPNIQTFNIDELLEVSDIIERQKIYQERPSHPLKKEGRTAAALASCIVTLFERASYNGLTQLADNRDLIDVASSEDRMRKIICLANDSTDPDIVPWIENNSLPKALVLRSVDDHNGALGIRRGLQRFSDLSKAYNMRLQRVRSEQELWAVLDESSSTQKLQPLEVVVIEGHGSMDSLTVNGSSKLSVSSDTKKAAAILGKLPPQATIVLNSCYTGKGKEKADNLANWVAQCAPHVRVFAPQDGAAGGCIKIKNLFPLAIQFLYFDDTKVPGTGSLKEKLLQMEAQLKNGPMKEKVDQAIQLIEDKKLCRSNLWLQFVPSLFSDVTYAIEPKKP